MLQCTCPATYSTLVSVGPACALTVRPYWKFQGRELQSATGHSASLDHESATLYLLLFVTQTRPCASGNSWKRFFSSDGHGAGGVELAPLSGLAYLLTPCYVFPSPSLPFLFSHAFRFCLKLPLRASLLPLYPTPFLSHVKRSVSHGHMYGQLSDTGLRTYEGRTGACILLCCAKCANQTTSKVSTNVVLCFWLGFHFWPVKSPTSAVATEDLLGIIDKPLVNWMLKCPLWT